MAVDNTYCGNCPFINYKSKKCPIYELELERNGKNIIRLKICIEENKGKFGGSHD